MAQNSAIEWTETTWNPLTGCTKISPGCKHCYAERMSLRLQAMGQANYANGFDLTLHEHMLEVVLAITLISSADSRAMWRPCLFCPYAQHVISHGALSLSRKRD